MHKKHTIKIRRATFLGLLFFVVLGFLIINNNHAQAALLNQYNKINGGTLQASEWNNLLADFVTKNNGGDRLDGFYSINTATSSAYRLDINGALRATSITGALSGTLSSANVSAGLFGDNTGGGNYNFPANIGIGIGTTTPPSIITLANDRWVSARNSAGNGYVNIFKVNANDEIEIGGALNIGNFQFPADSGFNTFVDMPVTSASPNDSIQGYVMKIDGDNILSVFSQSDGLGGIKNRRIGINTSTPQFDLDVNGIINASALYVNGAPYIGSQWTTNGTSIYYNTGNVGIGTTAPTQKLDVSGSIRSTNSSTFAGVTINGVSGMSLSSDNRGKYAFGTLTANGAYPLSLYSGRAGDFNDGYINLFTAGLERMRIDATGNVGIGTTSPQALLDVNGLIKMRSSTITANEDVVNKGYLDSALASTTAGIITQVATSSFWQGSLTGNVYNANTGNVGIGISNPSETLTVAKSQALSIIANEVYSSSNVNTSRLYLRKSISDNLGTRTTTTNGTYLGLINFQGVNTNGSFANGAYIFASQDASAGVYVPTRLDFTTYSATAANSPSLSINSAGNVGIGTTNPAQILTTGGNTGTIQIGTGGLIQPLLSRDVVTGGLIVSSVGDSGDFIFVGTGGLEKFRITDIGNVGIGTTAPQAAYLLDVNGNIRNTGNLYTAGSSSLFRAVSSGSDGVLEVYKAGLVKNIQIHSDGDSYLNGGNVGIGTTTPDSRLSVSGGNIFINDAAITSGTPKAAITKEYLTSTLDAFNSETNLWKLNGSTLYSSSTDWNVGIGVNSASYPLVVHSDTAGTVAEFRNSVGNVAYINITDNSTGSGTSNGLTLGYNGQAMIHNRENTPMVFSTNDTGRMRIAASGGVSIGSTYVSNDPGTSSLIVEGNLGLGTTNPTTKLDVEGVIRTTTGIIAPLTTGDALYSSAGNNDVNIWKISYAGNSYGFYQKYVGTGSGDANALELWTTGEVNNDLLVYHLRQSGNMGFGTTNPSTAKIVIATSTNGYTLDAGNFKIGNVATPTFNLDAANKSYVDSTIAAATSSITLWGGTTSGNVWSLNSGNVGIGTTTPLVKLDVYSDATQSGINQIANFKSNNSALYTNVNIENVASTGYIASALTLVSNASSRGGAFINYNKSSKNTWGFGVPYQNSSKYQIGYLNDGSAGPFYQSGTMYVDNALITFDGPTKNVGIGTTSPIAKLHVADGNIRLSANGAGGARLIIDEEYGTGGEWSLQSGKSAAVDHTFFIRNIDNNLDAVAVTKTGFVGIGTTTPGTRLTVVGFGNYSIDAGNYRIGNVAAPVLAQDAVNKSYVDSAAGGGVGPGTNGQTLRHDGTSWVANSALFNNGTNVGIGTTNPTQKLNVIGAGHFLATGDEGNNSRGIRLIPDIFSGVQEIRTYGSNTTKINAYNTGNGLINAGLELNVGSGYVAFSTSPYGTAGSEKMRINSSGNVGIGTINPDAKLQVQGTLKLQNIVSSSPDTNFRRMINVASYNGGGTYRTGILTVKLPSPLAHSMAKIKISGWSYGQAWDVIVSGYLNTTQWTQVGGTVVTGNPPFNTDQIRLVADSASDTFYILLGDAATTYGYYASIGVDVDSIYSNNLPSTGWDIYIAASDPSFDYVTTPASSLYGSHGADINNGNVYINDAVITSGTPKAAITKEYLTSTLNAFNSETNLWKLNGSNLYASTTTWNVGIGTTNPNEKLNVNGNVDIDGRLIVGSNLSYFTNNASATFYSGTTDRALTLRTLSSPKLVWEDNGGTGQGAIDASGNIGIGKINPGRKLEIQTPVGSINNGIGLTEGTGSLRGTMSINTNTDDYLIAANQALRFYAGSTIGNTVTVPTNERMVIAATGNVGIGTTNPTAKLDLTGDLIIRNGAASGTLYSNGGNFIMAQNYGSSFETILASIGSVRVALDTNNNDANKAFIVTGNSLLAGNELFKVNESGNVGISTSTESSRLDVAGGNIFIHDASITSGTPKAAITKEYLTSALDAFNTENNLWKLNGSNLYASTTNWNVGIGTTNPSTKLHVYASTNNIGLNLDANGVPGLFLSQEGAAKWAIASRTSDSSNLYFSVNPSGTSGSAIASAAKFTFTQSGNLGIGTSNPVLKLEVQGAVRIQDGVGDDNKIFIGNLTNATNERLLIGTGLNSVIRENAHTNASLKISGDNMDAGGSLILYSRNHDSFPRYVSLLTAGVQRLVIDGAGNVGIGTTTPGTRLTVVGNGNYSIDAGNYRVGNIAAPVLATDAVNKSYVDSAAGGGVDPGTTGQTLRHDGTSWVANSLLFNNGTNVGIGTSNPLKRLHVAQDVTYSQSLSGQLYLSSADGVKRLMLGYDSTNNFGFIEGVNFGTSYSNVVINPVQGNVGIGTTAPGAKLDVQGGSIRTSNNVSLGFGGLLYWGGNSGYTTIQGSGQGAQDNTSYLDFRAGDAVRMRINGAGNVGIGTTSPAQKLQISGGSIQLDNNRGVFSFDTSGGVVNAFHFNNANNFIFGYRISGSGNFPVRFYTGSSERIRISADGNVGIGTTTPTSKLAVSGGNIFINDASITSGTPKAAITKEYLDSAFDTIVGDNVGSGTTGQTLRHDGTSWVANSLLFNNGTNIGIGMTNPTYKLDVADGLVRQSGFLVADAATDNMIVNGDFEMNSAAGWSGINGITTGGVSGNYAAQITGYRAVTSDDLIPVDPTRDIFQLDAWVKKSVAGTTPGIIYFGYMAYDANKALITSAPCGTYCYFAASGYTIPVDGNWHKLSATTVGEGTVFPNFPVGTRYVRVMGLINYNASADSVTLLDHVTLKRITKGPLIAGNNFSSSNQVDNNQYSTLYTNSSNNLIIDTPGNVGIGTVAPNKKLHIYSTSPNAEIDIQSVAGAGNHWGLYNDISNNSFKLWGGADHLTVLRDGRVGIGTTNPGAKLEIAGGGLVITNKANPSTPNATILLDSWDNNAESKISFSRGGVAETSFLKATFNDGGADANSLIYKSGSQGHWFKNSAENDVMRITNTGNVGIGTTNPGSYKLYVNGDTNINGTLTATSFVGPVTGTLNAANVSSGAFGGNTGGGNYSFPGKLSIGTTSVSSAGLLVNGAVEVGRNGILGTYNSSEVQGIWTISNGYQISTANNDFGSQYGMVYAHTNAGTTGTKKPIAGWGHQILFTNSGNYTAAISLGSGNAYFGGVVGIGTTNPGSPLEIKTAGNDIIKLNRDGWIGGEEANILFSHNNSYNAKIGSWVEGGGSMVALRFYTVDAGAQSQKMIIRGNGNVGIGTTDPGVYRLKVAGDVAITGTLQTQTGSDFAEEFSVLSDLEAGTVVTMAEEGYKSVRAANKAYDSQVVGIVSDNPSIIAGRVESEKKVVVAMMGVVSVKVSDINGEVRKGDLLTSSSISGYAMKAVDYKPGTIIGKALEDLTGKSGSIKVLVNLQ